MFTMQIGDEMLCAFRKVKDRFKIYYLGACCTDIRECVRQQFEDSAIVFYFFMCDILGVKCHGCKT